jgi:hypothetical protein
MHVPHAIAKAKLKTGFCIKIYFKLISANDGSITRLNKIRQSCCLRLNSNCLQRGVLNFRNNAQP